MTIGEKIRIARENANLTQEELGKKCGTTKQTIYKYESGVVTNIPIDRIEMIASVVGVSSASLLGWEEEKTKPTVEDGFSENKKALIEFARTVPEDKASLILQVMQTIVASDE